MPDRNLTGGATKAGPPQPTMKGNSGCVVGGVAVLILLAVISLARCHPSTSTSAADAANAIEANLTEAISAQKLPPVKRLNHTTARRGLAHYALATKVEGLSGAMIYSQNCYDALAKDFSWAKLDQCGSFDAIAVRALPEQDPSGFDKEIAWFHSETAAGRYLSSATGAGEKSNDADQRWSAIQGLAAKTLLPKPSSSIAADTASDGNPTDTNAIASNTIDTD